MNYKDTFEELPMSVLLFRRGERQPIVYMNRRARMILAPSYSVDSLISGVSKPENLPDLLKFKNASEYGLLQQTARNMGYVENYQTEIITSDGASMAVSIAGAPVVSGDETLFSLYIHEDFNREQALFENQLINIINTVFVSDNVENSINAIMAISGEMAQVSRVYVFEEISPSMTRNTYEWCAKGIKPAIQDLQNLPKADYNYDVIVNSGMYIVHDVSQLPDKDREILEMQGIKALALLSLYDEGKPIGYVGFDDCDKTRNWSHVEINYLKGIASLLYMLIKRRRVESDLRYYASTDALTGIVNREWGTRKLEELLENGAGGSLCFIDIDGLKYTNDNYGHVHEDELLQEIVGSIKDGFTGDSFLCRWGGDEFLLWAGKSPDELDKSIKAIQQKLEELNKKQTKPYTLSFSYGIVAFTGASLDELTSTADERMYTNKMGKRGLRRRKSDSP